MAGEISAQICLDSQKLPVTLLVSESLPPEQKLIKRGDQRTQSEQFIVFDQNGQPLQYEHMVRFQKQDIEIKYEKIVSLSSQLWRRNLKYVLLSEDYYEDALYGQMYWDRPLNHWIMVLHLDPLPQVYEIKDL